MAMGRKKIDNVVLADGVEFAAPRGRNRTRAYPSLDTVVLVAIAIWGIAATVGRYPAFSTVAGVFYFEVLLVRIRLLTNSGGVVFDPALAERVRRPLLEMCALARCEIPRVVIRDDAIRVAAVRQVRRRTLLILSRRFIDQVGDRQLRAIIAHEVVHIARSDLRRAKTRAVLAIVCAVVSAVLLSAAVTRTLMLAMYVASILMFQVAFSMLFGVFNRPLERRADIDGAWLAADAEGMAQALAEAHGLSSAMRRDLFGAGPWRWLVYPLSVSAPTHPAMSKRIRTLREMSAAGAAMPTVS